MFGNIRVHDLNCIQERGEIYYGRTGRRERERKIRYRHFIFSNLNKRSPVCGYHLVLCGWNHADKYFPSLILSSVVTTFVCVCVYVCDQWQHVMMLGCWWGYLEEFLWLHDTTSYKIHLLLLSCCCRCCMVLTGKTFTLVFLGSHQRRHHHHHHKVMHLKGSPQSSSLPYFHSRPNHFPLTYQFISTLV